jgi:hypothetical protein
MNCARWIDRNSFGELTECVLALHNARWTSEKTHSIGRTLVRYVSHEIYGRMTGKPELISRRLMMTNVQFMQRFAFVN